jgi:outer membrane protein assembly factor BamD (BamD/ComL family)
VAAAHPGTGAGGRALLLAADAFFRDGKFSEAQAQFEAFLREHPENPLAPFAALGVAASMDSMNKTNEALAAYKDLLSRFAGSTVTAQAKLGLARLYEGRGEPAQALKFYDELTRPNVQSTWSSEAAMWREQLLSRHPELAKTNAPASPSAGTNVSGLVLPGVTATNPAPAAPDNPK